MSLCVPSAYADASGAAQTLSEQEQKLARVMDGLKSCYNKNPVMQAKLARVEQKWLAYRSSMSEAAFPRAKQSSIFEAYGSLGAEQLTNLMVSLTNAHISHLETFYTYDTAASECKDITNY